LERSGEAETLRAAHFAYYLDLVERGELELFRADQRGWLARYEREHDNLHAALGWARDRGKLAPALRLAGAAYFYWETASRFTEARGWLEQLLAVAERAGDTGEAISPATRAKVLFAAGEAAVVQGDISRGAPLLEQSLALAHELPGYLAGFALNALGAVASAQGHIEQAMAYFQEALEQLEPLGDPTFTSIPLNNLGTQALLRGDLDQATNQLAQALELARHAGDRPRSAYALFNLAKVKLRRGDLARAATLGREALAVMRDFGSPYYLEGCIDVLGEVAWGTGQGKQAARLQGAAAALREIMGTPFSFNEEALAAERAALGEEQWVAAFAAGKALTREEAIAEALGEAELEG
jgi:non-specific serine/threonine protein kinase